jgi:uncharacterized membrane protein YdjX (TVP38/TMEM64 family)
MKTLLKLALFFIFVSVIVYVMKFSPWSAYFYTDAGRLELQKEFTRTYNELGSWAGVIFAGIYALSVLLFIPASVFTSIGGVVFGKWQGLLLNLIGANVGGVISFFAARYLLREIVSKILKGKHFKKFDDKIETHGFSIILYMRLLFVPFTYLSFAAGLSKIKFRDFFWSTFLGIIPGIAVVTFLADAVKRAVKNYSSPADLLTVDILLPVALFIFSFFIPPLIKHFKKKFFVTAEIEKETEAME